MRSFEKFETAPLLVWNASVGELDLEIGGEIPGAKEHGDLAQRNSFLVQLQQTVDDKLRLLVFIAHRHKPWRLAPGALGPQLLRVSLETARNERVCGLENRFDRTIVALQRHNPRSRKLRREVEDVAYRRATKRVDALRIVAHNRDAAVGA